MVPAPERHEPRHPLGPGPRRGAPRPGLGAVACLALAAGLVAAGAYAPRQASAQASVDALRQRLAALRATDPQVPAGTLTSIAYLLDIAERIERRHPGPSVAWRRQAERFLASAEEGRDPYPEGKGQLLNRGYAPTFTPQRQGYGIYLPRDYDPSRAYPLLVMLHGGSSNGNLFLAVVLGNNLDWETYRNHLYDDFTARWFPDWIVVAPDGVGQVMWRWMGEQDVLEVIADVQRHYRVDPDRIVLGGLSNGGVGAYAIGARHAWRFSHVQAIAGAPSWVQYAGGRPTQAETAALLPWSALHLFRNTLNTDFHYYHGTQDGGPMRPAFVRELTAHLQEEGIAHHEHWFEHGHDLLYLVHRHGRVYDRLAERRRSRSPAEVWVVTGDYRARRQHWVSVERVARYPDLARVHARAEDGRVALDTDNVLEVALHLRDVPETGDRLALTVDGEEVYAGPRADLGHRVHLARVEDRWGLGFLPEAEGLEKVPGLSGPLSDAYFDEIIHVYGTGDEQHERALRRTAERGAAGWPQGVWNLGQRVVADRDVTPAMIRSAHLALYGAPGDNAILERVKDALPIRVQGDAVLAGSQRFAGRDVGARLIYPNPEAPDRYLLVHTGVTVDAVERTRNLPDFLPDYVVYDQRSTARRPRLIAGRYHQLAAGYFDRFWRLPPDVLEGATTADADPDAPLPPGVTRAEMRALAVAVGAYPGFVIPSAVLPQSPPSSLPPGPVPPEPPRPRRFAAPADDPAGAVAREIARLVPTFYNYRAIIPGGRWRRARRARFQIRPEAECLEALVEARVPTVAVSDDLGTPIPTPRMLIGPVGGVTYVPYERDDGTLEPIVVSCELAARLPYLSRRLRRYGIDEVVILSSHRDHPAQSFHRMGMALDILSFHGPDGTLSVYDDFLETPDEATCDAPRPPDRKARTLLAIACDLARGGRFQSVLTPNYNDGHRNHLHLDIRPNDPRVFVR
ncbi:MAG: extensin family protein [Sandaracinaceae bacterium]